MALELKYVHHEESRSAVVQLVGACACMDHVAVDDRFEDVFDLGIDLLVLDLSHLGGINDLLAGCLAAWRRRFLDRGARFVFIKPNVVVRWVLERKLGTTLDLCVSVEAALQVPTIPVRQNDESVRTLFEAGGAVSSAGPAGGQSRILNSSRPDRHILAGVMACLNGDPNPLKWRQSLSSALARAGLAVDLDLCVLRGRRFEVVAHPHHTFCADGWLASYLQGADCPLAGDEVGRNGLADDERGFLSWSRADVIVPVVFGDHLVGILALRSGRQGGMSSYRSGEILALALLSRQLVEPLLSIAEPMIEDAPGEVLHQVVLPRN